MPEIATGNYRSEAPRHQQQISRLSPDDARRKRFKVSGDYVLQLTRNLIFFILFFPKKKKKSELQRTCLGVKKCILFSSNRLFRHDDIFGSLCSFSFFSPSFLHIFELL
jgi:hypothetical protein